MERERGKRAKAGLNNNKVDSEQYTLCKGGWVATREKKLVGKKTT